MDNLILLCRRHHRMVHEEGWQLVVTAEGNIVALMPDRFAFGSVPP